MAYVHSVSEAAEKIGVSPDTIRRWEKKGLIRARRNEFNHRLFDVNEVHSVNQKMTCSEHSGSFRVLKTNRKNKFTTIELFAGAGGTALGFENSGFEHVVLVENDKHAVATLQLNRPRWNVLCKDVREVDFSEYNADVIQAGFPCQSFSYAGKKMGFEDIRGTLFFEFARSIKQVRPKVIIGENVRGLLRHDDGKTLETILSVLRELGYRIAYRVLRSQYFDVPQKRERLIIMGVRDDLDYPFIFPKEKSYIVSLQDALKGCPPSDGQEYPERKRKILELVPPGGYWRDLPLDLQKEYMGKSFYMGGGKTGMARRLSWDEPSLTLTCSPAQKQTERCHPDETRPLNVREYARIQTFPDKWEFVGSTAARYKQIGNAVPVNLGYHIGRCVAAMLSGEVDHKTMEVVALSEVQKQGSLFQNALLLTRILK
ncbi:MAG: DNA (cytosine-5-)-methyltransferase [Candidatus Uhrbacteria bacterium]|nr:DNA (cytosine-5-)-methyltransferase [Candidatus Uhrbacteria bacterium]